VAIADRAMLWLWTEFGPKKGKLPKAKPRKDGDKPRVNIIGPSYGMFNMPSDLAEIRRLVEGIGAEVNLVFPLGSHLADIPSWSMPTSTSACTASLAARCARRWTSLTCRPRSAAFDNKFLRTLGELLGIDPEPFIEREKHTTIKPLWDLVALGHPGLLRHRQFRHRGQRDLCPRRPQFPRNRDGAALHVCLCPPGRRQAGQPGSAGRHRQTPPLVMFGSYNERMYMAEAGCRAVYVPASFPGAVIRRHTGTPFMGYSGATYLVQEVCNGLFDALFNILPLAKDLDQVDATPARLNAQLGWSDDARVALDRLVEQEPVLVRISAAKRLRDAAERHARDNGNSMVSPEHVASVAARLGNAA
jgi:chlorophyllide a reductase subunit Z